MGRYTDLLASGATPDQAAPDQTPPPGSGRYKAIVGAQTPKQSAQSDYEAAKAKGRAAVQAFSKGGEDFGGPLSGFLNRGVALAAGTVAPIAGELGGGVAALGNVISNAKARASGQPTTDTEQVYRGTRDATDEFFKGQQADHPVASLTGNIAGAMAGGEAAGAGLGALKGTRAVGLLGDAISNTSTGAKAIKALKTARLAAEIGWKPGVAQFAENVAKAVPAGVLTGGALGAAEGEGSDRLGNAGLGGLLGGLTSAGVEAALPVAKLGGAAVNDARRFIKNLLTEAPPPGTITPAETAAAKATVAEMAARKGVTSSNYADKVAGFSDPLLAQTLGTEGVNTAASLARRAGATGDTLRNTVYARAQARPAAIKQAVQETLGVSPDQAAGALTQQMIEGRAAVAPMFAEATAGDQGITRPDLEHLLGSDTGKSLIDFIRKKAGQSADPAEGLTVGRVEVPPPGETVNPMEAPPVGEFSEQPPPVPRGPAQAPTRGLSLVNWMARQGGAVDTGGELAAMGADKIGARSQMSPQELDTLAEAAQKAGYFPESQTGGITADTPDNYTTVTGEHLKEAIRQEIAGQKVRYPREADPQAQQRFEARRQAEADQARYDQRPIEEPMTHEEYQSLETGYEPPPEGYGGAGEPQFEPATQTAFTPAALNKIRQYAGEDVKRTFGKVDQGRKNLLKEDFRQRLNRILLGHPETGEGALMPKLRAPVERSGDYLGHQQAYNDFKGRLIGGSMEDFGKAVASLKDRSGEFVESKLAGAQGGMASDVAELWGKGQLKGGKFTVPGVQERLGLIFGKEGARKFVGQMEKAMEQSALEARMAPYSNSSTAAMQSSGAEVDKSAGEHLATIGDVASKGVGGAVSSLMKNAGAYLRSPGSTVGYRDALGKLLQLTPEEATALLRELETAPAPRKLQSTARERGIVAGTLNVPRSSQQDAR